jgi:hypothetical protein
MRVQDLSKITLIDTEITQLQHKLAMLYGQRSALVDGNIGSDINKYSVMTEKCHQELSKIWHKYTINIPPISSLGRKITKALQIISNLENEHQDLRSNLKILLVPPASKLKIPLEKEVRQQQRLLWGNDCISDDIVIHKGSNRWKVLVVYARESGLKHSHDFASLYKNKYGDLGLREYIALTLQLSQPIDLTTWTSFSVDNNKSYACAGFRSGRYRIITNDIYGMMDDDRFRPAIEVK